jgi:sugar-specific transcriptional regulator TrmB
MSLERVLKALEEYKISKKEANIYIYLAKKGPKNSIELAQALKMDKRRLDSILQSIENKGLVSARSSCLSVYSALPFEKLIECLVHVKMQEAKEINNRKIELLALWKTLNIEKENEDLK